MLTSLSEALARVARLHPKIIDLHLERIEQLLEKLGRPQDRLPPVIHVAGTNGKGSTVAYLRAMLEAAGKRVHVYTSPHLVHFRERIRLAGALVDDASLVEAIDLCERLNEGAPITFFEITTAAAFHLFAETEADYLLLEVGLGGRFDATNVVDHPLGTIITPVSIDHVKFFGEKLAGIAREKTGILKRGAPAVIGKQRDEAMVVVETDTDALDIVPFVAGQDFTGYEMGGRLVYQDEQGLEDLPLPRLFGPHQIDNAVTAIAAVRHFGLPLTSTDIARGLESVQWPARMMRLDGKLLDRLPEESELWLDGGHNEAGALAIRQSLADLDRTEKRPLTLVVGMMASKEAEAYFRNLSGLDADLITLPIPGEPGAFDTHTLAGFAEQTGFAPRQARSLDEALIMAAERAPHRVLICGSLYLAGHVLSENGTELA